MAKFVNSEDAVTSDLLLWNTTPTQVYVEDVYETKVWPIISLNNDGPITFNIPPQPNGMMRDVQVVTKFKIQENRQDFTEPKKNFTLINNFANSLWSQVDVKIDDRNDITQSMRNAFTYSTYFNHVLNSTSQREDYLLYNEHFFMDTVQGKKWDSVVNSSDMWMVNEAEVEKLSEEGATLAVSVSSETRVKAAIKSVLKAKLVKNPNHWIKNVAFGEQVDGHCARGKNVIEGKSSTVRCKLQCPLFNTSKCLPSNMKVRISLVKNEDKFLILSAEDSQYNVIIENIYLQLTYVKPREKVLNAIHSRLDDNPAVYCIQRPEVSFKPITSHDQVIRITDIFHDKIPSYAFFCLQDSRSLEGSYHKNPFVFYPFKKFQIFINGRPFFIDSLNCDVEAVKGELVVRNFSEYFEQLYKTVGRDLKSDLLINSKNFNASFMVGISFGADRSSIDSNHLNLQESGSTYLEIDLGYPIERVGDENLILITYAVYDTQVEINKNREIRFIE